MRGSFISNAAMQMLSSDEFDYNSVLHIALMESARAPITRHPQWWPGVTQLLRKRLVRVRGYRDYDDTWGGGIRPPWV
jgi:hypothetical protein